MRSAGPALGALRGLENFDGLFASRSGAFADFRRRTTPERVFQDDEGDSPEGPSSGRCCGP